MEDKTEDLIGPGPVPLYLQLQSILEEHIARGDFKPGMPLPSEQELISTYNISRTTVRQALNRLAESNLVIKVQGKGTFVAQPEIKQELVSLRTISEVLTSAGLVPEVRVLELDVEPAVPVHIREQLQLQADDPVIRVKRQHLVQGEPVAFAVIYLSGKFQWRFSAEDLIHQSIYSWLEEKEQVVVDQGLQVIRAIAADNEITKALELETGAPVLHVENTTLTDSGVPIDHTEFYFPPERYALTVTLRRTHGGVSLEKVKAGLS